MSLTSSPPSAKSSSLSSLRLRLLSSSLQVVSDDPRGIDLLRFQYRHFLEKAPFRRPHRRIVLKMHASQPSLSVGAKRLSLPPGCSLNHGLSLVLESLLDAIRGHLVFHAGVVSCEGRGLVVCGPPGFGKTSLVLTLAHRGLGFLSDDYAPIDVRNGRVLPFPRSVGIVAASRPAGSLLPGVPPDSRVRIEGKWLVDPVALGGVRLAGPCRPAAVLLLGPPSGMTSKATLRYDLSMDRGLAPSLRRQLRGAGFRKLRSSRGSERLRLSLPGGHRLAARLQDWVARHRSRVFTLERVHAKSGIFQSRLDAQAIPPSEGLVEILSDLHNRRPGSKALAKGKMSPADLLLASARLLGEARFVRLRGGTPSRRADAALEILRSSGGRW